MQPIGLRTVVVSTVASLLGRPGTIKDTDKSALDGTVLSGVKVTVGSAIAQAPTDESGIKYSMS